MFNFNLIRRLVILCLLLMPLLYQGGYYLQSDDKVQERYYELEALTQKTTDQIASYLQTQPSVDSVFRFILNQHQASDIYSYVFKEKQLIAWNDNHLPITADLLKIPSGRVIQYDHNIVLVNKKRQGDYEVLSVALIQGDYGVHNQYLKPHINPLLHLSSDKYQIVLSKTESSSLSMSSQSGNEVFFVVKTMPNHLIPLWVWEAFFLGLLLFLTQVFWTLQNTLKQRLFIVALLLWRVLSIYFHWPEGIYQLDIFRPYIYSYNAVFPSLGDTFINLWVLFLMVEWSFRWQQQKKFLCRAMALVYIIALPLLMILFRSVIFDSNVELYVYSITQVSASALLVVMVLLLIGYIVFRLWQYVASCMAEYSVGDAAKALIYSLLLIIVFLELCILGDFSVLESFVIDLFFFIFLITIWGKTYLKTDFSYWLIIFLFLALSTVSGVFYFAEKKEENIKLLLASKLSFERDYVAESLFPDMATRLSHDQKVRDYMVAGQTDSLDSYLKHRYFYGFWVNYDVQTTVCQPFDSLNIVDNHRIVGCYHFFDSTIQQVATAVLDSSFYFLDNNNGRVSYLGVFRYHFQDSVEKRLFLEIDSKLISVKLGYPELLLDYDVQVQNRFSKYSYAKYLDGHLVSQYGDYTYSFSAQHFLEKMDTNAYAVVYEGADEHLLYKAGNRQLIVITGKQKTVWDFVQEFSYFFVLLLLYAGIYRLVFLSEQKQWVSSNFKQRIQRAVFLMLLSFLITVLLVMVYYSYHQINNRYTQEIKERMGSLNVELSQKIGQYDTLSHNDIPYLESLLSEFSNVFFTDMHLYAPDGILLASSRPVIFEKYMIGTQMNTQAFVAMHQQHLTQYVHSETIGNLQFLSAYMPIMNANNRVIAYINFPYFTRQIEIHKQLAGMVVTIVNVFLLLLILSFFVLYIVAEALTNPLEVIRKSLASVRLGESNKKIIYSKNDEIARLVNEYNRMIDELQESAHRLAESERESAWREMARQVAHEIKNPLTPMKLNIQYLQQTWQSHADTDLDDFIDKITKSLLEQIDTLTVIANEFSHFSTMQKEHPEAFDVVEKITSILKLYENTDEHIQLSFENETGENPVITFDINRFTQIINNLLKNAIQAIPSNQDGEVKIILRYPKPKTLQVIVSDNGIGIPKEIQSRIFQPNFTTKSSGMGIGLAVVKAMVESSNGKIKFETEDGKGTRFVVDFFYGEDEKE